MENREIVEMLNEDRARELAVIIQYMKHHYEMTGPESLEIADKIKAVAIDEMRHAEALGERIDYLGGEPTKKPDEIKSGGDNRQMIGDDLVSESFAIQKYREHIKRCDELGDPTTRRLLEGILAQEEAHANLFETYLGTKK